MDSRDAGRQSFTPAPERRDEGIGEEALGDGRPLSEMRAQDEGPDLRVMRGEGEQAPRGTGPA